MNTKHIRIIAGLIVILGLIGAHMAVAQDIVINSAKPSSAEQGTLGQDVTIGGIGFDRNIKKVEFLLPCTPEPCAGSDGGITVTQFNVKSSTELIAWIDISDTADISLFDIVMSTRGRGGKGTTYKGANLFEVKIRPNQNLVNCAPFTNPNYDPENPVTHHPGTCDCKFFLTSEVNSGTPPSDIYNMVSDCETAETLYIPQFSNIRSAGAVQGEGSERKTITAVNPHDDSGNRIPDGLGGYLPFDGEAIIENTGHRAIARDFNLAVAADVEAGCDSGIHSALRFRLHEGSPDPTVPDPFYVHTHWRIQDLYIDSLGDPLCRGIDIWREDSYTQTYDSLGAYDARIFIAGGWIKPGSYTETAIRFGGFKWKSGAHNPPEVIGVRVEPQADGAIDAVAIEFGDISNSDPSAPYHGLIAENVINLSGNGTGILAYGEADGIEIEDNTFRIDKNTIGGADLGIYVDNSVNDVNFSGNILTGVDGSDDTAICSLAASTGEKGKPNRISGFEPNEVLTGDCP